MRQYRPKKANFPKSDALSVFVLLKSMGLTSSGMSVLGPGGILSSPTWFNRGRGKGIVTLILDANRYDLFAGSFLWWDILIQPEKIIGIIV